jgi:hypothetical protein
MRVHVDLGNLIQGKHYIRLSDKNIYLPSGIDVENIIPRKIKVILTRVQKTDDRGQKTDEMTR